MADAPNHRRIVEQVNDEYPHLLRHNTYASCAEFEQRVLKRLPPNEEWGHVGKSSGEKGHTFPNDVRVSHDAIFSRKFNRQVDIIKGGGGHPAPGGVDWREIHPSEYRPSNVWTHQQPLFDSGTPGAGEQHVALLSRSWFCFMRALQDWHTEALACFEWLLDKEKNDNFRVMLAVEGIDHISGGRPDVWRDAGVFIDAPWWDDRFVEMLDLFGNSNKQGWLTVYGGRNQTPTPDSRRRFNDRIVRLCEGRWDAVLGFEVANEYNVNRWTESEVREIGRDLRSKIPAGKLLALSSPDLAHGDAHATTEEILDSMERLYGGDGAGANCMTIHVNRDPNSPWADPFSYNALMPHLPKINNEPPGQGASAGGDVVDPATLVDHYVQTSKAGWLMHVPHNAWGVWNGRIPSEYSLSHHHRVRLIWEQQNQTAISRGLAEYRTEGSVVVPGPVDPPGKDDGDENDHGDKLMPGQSLMPGQRLVSPAGVCYMEYQHDGNLVVHNTEEKRPVWASGTEGTSPGSAQMQTDGNFVIRVEDGTPIRATRTDGHPGAMIQLQDDGNFVMYFEGDPIWASASSEFFD